MTDGLYLYIDENKLIIALQPFSESAQRSLESVFEVLDCQLLTEIPIVCMPVFERESYPFSYPGTMLIPEREWSSMEIVSPLILMNETFLMSCFGKRSIEVGVADLLSVFDMLTDSEALTKFSDTHGLIIGGAILPCTNS